MFVSERCVVILRKVIVVSDYEVVIRTEFRVQIADISRLSDPRRTA